MIKTKYILSSACLLICLMAILAAPSCRKLPKTYNDGTIAFSSDTLFFDTVFTDAGTSTRTIKIINKENKRINLSSIRLFRGSTSPYFINVNGKSGKAVNDITIEANDSVYVFASVYINPANQNDPFLVEDRLVATVGGSDFEIPIIGYGQDAIYIKDSVLLTQTWNSTKPYVIINNAWVEEGNTLTIEAGTRVYVHADSRLYVDGSLKINGTQTDSVVFQGDRIDRRIYYGEDDFVNGVGGEWGGLYFTDNSFNNSINYAIFKNGGAQTYLFDTIPIIGATIQVDPDEVNTVINDNPKLKINNSIIRNSAGYGIFSYGGSIRAENCLIFASGKENVALVRGGYYQFLGCTMAGYTARDNSALAKYFGVAAINFFKISDNNFDVAELKAIFRNCIIYGNAETEFIANKLEGTSDPQVSVENCLIKTKDPIASWVNSSNNIFNESPIFVNTNYNNLAENDYHTEADSPDKGKGISFSGMLPLDLSGVGRANPPSIGCYE